MKIENERFSVACSLCLQNLKFVDFTSCLCRGPQTYLLKSVLCSTIIYALLTNDIIVLWRCRSRSRRRFLNSLIYWVNLNTKDEFAHAHARAVINDNDGYENRRGLGEN